LNAAPRRITANVSTIEFFDPISGRPRVWYYKASDGSYELFDARGFHPGSSEPLIPATKEVVADIVKRSPKSCFTFNDKKICE
jgi:hypothetical protein